MVEKNDKEQTFCDDFKSDQIIYEQHFASWVQLLVSSELHIPKTECCP